MLFINNKEVGTQYTKVAYDGCHKLYLCRPEDEQEALGYGYELFHIESLPGLWDMSCSLRFIYTWEIVDHRPTETWVRQCEGAKFEWR